MAAISMLSLEDFFMEINPLKYGVPFRVDETLYGYFCKRTRTNKTPMFPLLSAVAESILGESNLRDAMREITTTVNEANKWLLGYNMQVAFPANTVDFECFFEEFKQFIAIFRYYLLHGKTGKSA
jgi:hypothetical protein